MMRFVTPDNLVFACALGQAIATVFTWRSTRRIVTRQNELIEKSSLGRTSRSSQPSEIVSYLAQQVSTGGLSEPTNVHLHLPQARHADQQNRAEHA